MKKRVKPPKLPETIAIGERLREIRKEKGFRSYEHISYELGMSRSAYWRLEKGDNFQIKTLIKLCKQLGVTLEEFFQGCDFPKPAVKKKR